MTQVTAEMLRRGRDLADMDSALKAERDGLIFMETSKKADIITLYAMSDGEPIPMPQPIAEMAIKKRYKGGGYMFTDNPAEAPAYKLGEVKCFLHRDSPERQSGALEEVGIAGIFCTAEHLASKYSRRVHAENRHGKRWAAYQEHMKELREESDRKAQRQQLEATLALAGKAAGVKAVRPVTVEAVPLAEVPAGGLSAETVIVRHDCSACGWVNEKNTQQGLEIHARRWCPKKGDGDAVTE